MRRPALVVAALGALATSSLPTSARADGVFSGRIGLTGFFYLESDGVDPTMDPMKKTATTANLAFGELRLTMNGLRMAKGKVDFRIDTRVRLTGDFDFERKFSQDINVFGPDGPSAKLPVGISSRGYLGGREYDVRELYVLIRPTDRMRIQLGRMFVIEGDNLKLDGLRIGRTFGPHWEGSVYGGLYSNPYSRSVLTDYAAPCSPGVAGTSTRQGSTTLDVFPCDPNNFVLGVAAGLGARYAYDTLWGNFGLTGSFFLGPGDGGQVAPDPAATNPQSSTTPVTANLLAGSDSLDAPRVFLSWMNSWRPAERVDLLSDLVFDIYGSAGPQPTRAIVLSTIRILRDDHLTLRLGYSHLSSLAINMFLARLVYNRLVGTTLQQQGVSSIENNLTILRTGRDEGRVTLDSRIVRKLGAFVEGRIRDRFLIGGDSNPNVYGDKTIYGANTKTLAFDVSGGLRDNGSLKGVRLSLSYSGIFDFRANNHVINFDIGRDFANERFGFTLNYVVAITQDKLPTGQTMGGQCDFTDPFKTCFGSRNGQTHEVGLQLTAAPVRSLFFLLDYRFIALVTKEDLVAGATTFPTTLSHAILFRTEYRWN